MARDLSKYLTIIQNLLNQADSAEELAPKQARPDLVEEYRKQAANYRAKAEELMRKYRIEEEELLAVDPQSIEPVYVKIVLTNIYSPFRQSYLNMFHYIANHAEIRSLYQWGRDESGNRVLTAHCVGYEGDVRLAQALYANARMVFAEHLEPKVNTALSDQENCYRLRRAGIERNKIAQMLWGADMKDGAAHGKVAKLYQAECAKRGEDAKVTGRQLNAKTFREAYAQGFTNTIWDRLYRARIAADATGGVIQLAGRQERVNEAFYTRFPSERPSTEVVVTQCEKDATCKRSPGHKGRCGELTAQEKAGDKKARERVNRLYRSASGQAGIGAGEAAAAEVEINRNHEDAKRLDESDTTALAREIRSW